MSRRFSVPVHVVSPAPWGCEIKQYSHHLFHDFGRRARVQAGLYAFLPPFSSFRCIFSSGDIQHPPVRWTTSQRSCISIPFSPRLRDHSVGGCLMLISWSYFVHESLLCRGAAKLCSIPIIFLMSLGGARGFASRV